MADSQPVVQLEFLSARMSSFYYRSRHKHLRCFPQCTAGTHRDRSFCGDSLILNVNPLTPLLAETLDPSNTSVYGEFHKLEQAPILFSNNASLVRADLSAKIIQASFVYRQGAGLRFAFNPPRKWEYRARVKSTDLHTFTVAVAINGVVVISQSVQPFRIIPMAKTKAGSANYGEDDDEEVPVAGVGVAEDSVRSAALPWGKKNLALATTPQGKSRERPQDKLCEGANLNIKNHRKIEAALSTTLEKHAEFEAVARISNRSAVLQAHNRSFPTPSMAMGLPCSPSMSFMFPMGTPKMANMPYLSQTVEGPHQTNDTLPHALQPRSLFLSAFQPQGLGYMPHNTDPNSMMAFQQFGYAPDRLMINVVQVPDGSAVSMPPQMIPFGSQQLNFYSPSTFTNLTSAPFDCLDK